MSRTTKRNLIVIIVAVLAAVFISTLIGTMTNGFEDVFNPEEWNRKDVNTDNFISKENYLIKTMSYPNGLEVTVKDNGLIRVTGENKDSENAVIEICKVTLPAGTYTFTSGDSGTSASKYYLKAGDYYADFNNNTFTLAEETELTVSISVLKGEEVSATFSPVIVEGEKEGSFFID